jgi:hypothetical protein
MIAARLLELYDNQNEDGPDSGRDHDTNELNNLIKTGTKDDLKYILASNYGTLHYYCGTWFFWSDCIDTFIEAVNKFDLNTRIELVDAVITCICKSWDLFKENRGDGNTFELFDLKRLAIENCSSLTKQIVETCIAENVEDISLLIPFIYAAPIENFDNNFYQRANNYIKSLQPKSLYLLSSIVVAEHELYKTNLLPEKITRNIKIVHEHGFLL